MSRQLQFFAIETPEEGNKSLVNVASVPQRSPFRYPGGKTWLIPTVRRWLNQEHRTAEMLIEPFAGGGIVSLTAAFENLAKKIWMVELDQEVASVWETILNGKNEWLAERVFNFVLTHENVQAEFARPNKKQEDVAFCTILKNRVSHGGILAKGSGMLKKGESGKGIHSRWYPKTLRDRILAIKLVKHKIHFSSADAFDILYKNQKEKETWFFIDPPYSIAGKRLYTHSEINHQRLFELTAHLVGKFLMTYDDTPEIRCLAEKNNLRYITIPMKTTHHLKKRELLISDNFDWF